jgi:hypothetical protein
MNINITDINSAAISSLQYEAIGARWDDLTRVGTLIVTFKTGGQYAYHEVSVATMGKVLMYPSGSIGSAIAKLVRPAHSFTKLSDAVVAPTDEKVAQ